MKKVNIVLSLVLLITSISMQPGFFSDLDGGIADKIKMAEAQKGIAAFMQSVEDQLRAGNADGLAVYVKKDPAHNTPILAKDFMGFYLASVGKEIPVTPVAYAAFMGNVDMVQTLLSYNVSLSKLPGVSPIFGAISNYNPTMLQILLKSVGGMDSVAVVKMFGQTPLQYAQTLLKQTTASVNPASRYVALTTMISMLNA